jgi:hypothetical protein
MSMNHNYQYSPFIPHYANYPSNYRFSTNHIYHDENKRKGQGLLFSYFDNKQCLIILSNSIEIKKKI